MSDNKTAPVRIRGGCLCGRVRYEIRGEIRDVVNCHCSKCRAFHGHFAGYTSTARENLVLLSQETLRWYRSVTDETPDVHRGFCSRCGSSLFWDARGRKTIAVAAGSLEGPTGLRTIGHIWLDQAGDYYHLEDDLPKFPAGWE